MPQISRSALVAATPAAAYAVVVDVERYPDFLPHCQSVRVIETRPDGLVAQVTVAGRGITEHFVTTNSHQPDRSVYMNLREGPFRHLRGEWTFTALGEDGCRIDMHLEFAPKGVLARLLSGMAESIANRLVDAFSRRVEEHYARQNSASG